MRATHRTFVLREVSERDADHIITELHHLERAGHEIADVRHEGALWRIYSFDRRFHDAQDGMIAFRRRATD